MLFVLIFIAMLFHSILVTGTQDEKREKQIQLHHQLKEETVSMESEPYADASLSRLQSSKYLGVTMSLC